MSTLAHRALGATIVAVALFGGGLLAQTAVLTRLKANEAEVKNQIFSTMSSGGFLVVGTATVFKAAASDDRSAIVKAVMEFARVYSGTADFAKRYATYREGQKPVMEKVQTGEEMRAEMRKNMDESIKSAQDMIKQMPSMKEAMEAQIAAMKQQLAEMTTKEMAAQQDEAASQASKFAAENFKQQMAEFEKTYPVDAKPMVASRLREFLEMSAAIDFDAKTELKNKRQMFVNPDLERKDYRWKMLYRAGKPAVEAARAVAQEWLKNL